MRCLRLYDAKSCEYSAFVLMGLPLSVGLPVGAGVCDQYPSAHTQMSSFKHVNMQLVNVKMNLNLLSCI